LARRERKGNRPDGQIRSKGRRESEIQREERSPRSKGKDGKQERRARRDTEIER
jgi:hypothetical protein